MSPRTSDARDRMLDSASTLIREHGASGTSLDDVLRHSHAPRGSVYHYFPGGRAQLVEEVVDRAGDALAEMLRNARNATPATTFDAFISTWKASLEASGFRAGCPVLAVAVETNDEAPQLTQAAARAFGSWSDALNTRLRHHGVPPARARRLATLIVAAVEGAVALSRVERNTQPIDDVARELRALIRQAIGPS
ncbi:TetR/AcrR family transcriptional regulator [Mycolicibacterium austroafricanum]|uniref:TetR/AcrR family transcriptional regulator n=1 Tax=Mycolicibacterium austroafricanum TaxID=39687 RepID=UPI001CA37462|nr:TetR/AcrR family transcriptional regulator [Mycolicibacterium austroafricanum]QZT63126.1 TetR/AcrR family transcriptional regulator [Mycolicibacterium austroafricanum]